MRAVFVYDHLFIKQSNNIYSSGAFQSSSWERYLEFFDRVTIVGQLASNTKDTTLLNPVNHRLVDFKFIQEIKTAKDFINSRLTLNSQLTDIISDHDAVIVRLYSEWGLQAIKIAQKLGKPVAIEVVGCPWDAFINHPSFRAKLLAPVAYLSMRYAIKPASHVLYVTESFLQKRYPTLGHTIGASNVMLTIPHADVLSSRLGKIRGPSEKLKFGVIGKVDVKAKGISVLLKALSRVSMSVDFELRVVGPGNTQKLQNEAVGLGIADKVMFLGKLKAGDAINKFLDDIDLYIHPSKQEGLPRSVIEALSRACPVLASSIAGTPELLDTKYLHEAGDYEFLSQQIIEYSTDKKELSTMAKQNFEKAKDFYPDILSSKRRLFFENFFRYVKGKL